MDEVDGMSAGDRGGVGALNALIKKSKVPSSFLSISCHNVNFLPFLSDSYHLYCE